MAPAAQTPTTTGFVSGALASEVFVIWMKPGYWSSLVSSGPAPGGYVFGISVISTSVGSETGFAGNETPALPAVFVTTCGWSDGMIRKVFSGCSTSRSNPAKQRMAFVNASTCADEPESPPWLYFLSVNATISVAAACASAIRP